MIVFKWSKLLRTTFKSFLRFHLTYLRASSNSWLCLNPVANRRRSYTFPLCFPRSSNILSIEVCCILHRAQHKAKHPAKFFSHPRHTFSIAKSSQQDKTFSSLPLNCIAAFSTFFLLKCKNLFSRLHDVKPFIAWNYMNS